MKLQIELKNIKRSEIDKEKKLINEKENEEENLRLKNLMRNGKLKKFRREKN